MTERDNFVSEHPVLLAKLLNHTFDALLICKPQKDQLEAVYANQTYYSLTGQTEQDVIGLRPQLTARKPTANNIYEDILSHYQNNELLERECSCLDASGSPFWAQLKSFTVEEKENRYCVLLIKEITIRKKRESELTKALDIAEASKDAKDKFLANMSHEMRTPLNGILGIVQLLEATSLKDDSKNYVDEIKHSAENLLAIVNDILEFNFLKSSGFKPNNRKFSIRKTLKQIFVTIQDRADKKGLNLNLVISEKVPEQLIGDSVRLSQILMNLIGNAIKFTKDGEVAVYVRQLEVNNGRAHLEIKVKDTGIGIPESLVSEIFESFNQAAKTTTYKYGGTGMGLSIVKQLVGHMDGRIEIESREGEGTAVSITLPFELIKSSSNFKSLDEPSGADGKTDFEGFKVLIVDDYTVNRRIVKGMMKKLGVEVDEAEDGISALEMIAKNNYSVIFMDVHMPGMDGLEATQKIRNLEDDAKSKVPVIAITASVLDRDIEECKKAGMNGFIAKPFTFNELYERFNHFVSKDFSEETSGGIESKDTIALKIDNLEELTGGDDDLLKEMLDLFLEQTPEMMDKILDNLENENYEELKINTHTLKPTFTYVGIQEATELAEKIEEMAGRENPPSEELTKSINRLKEICDRSILEVQKMRRSLA
jgi:PAS domain S-box-containing protein